MSLRKPKYSRTLAKTGYIHSTMLSKNCLYICMEITDSCFTNHEEELGREKPTQSHKEHLRVELVGQCPYPLHLLPFEFPPKVRNWWEVTSKGRTSGGCAPGELRAAESSTRPKQPGAQATPPLLASHRKAGTSLMQVCEPLTIR